MKRSIAIIPILALTLLVAAVVACGTKTSSGPDSTETFTVQVRVVDETGRPFAGVTVSTNPVSNEVMTDSEGYALFEDISLIRSYLFIVKRDGYPNTSLSADFSGSEPPSEVTITITSLPPVIDILYPRENTLLPTVNLLFRARVTDLEDGVLPDSVVVWTSDLDGFVATGAEPSIPYLSPGKHELTITATDSDGKTRSKSVVVAVIQYDPESYFPLPVTAFWTYRHLNNTIYEPGARYPWEIEGVDVVIDQTNRRTATMEFRQGGISSKYSEYTVMDYYQNEGDALQVTRTTEILKKWSGLSHGEPTLSLRIETDYSSPMTLLNDIHDLSVGPRDYSSTITVSSTWYYTDNTGIPQSFPEHYTTTLDISLGDEVTLIAMGQERKAIPMIITQGTSIRKWWMTQGLGIVKFEHNTFGTTSVAEVSNSNIANLNVYGKAAARPAAPHGIIPYVNPVTVPGTATTSGPQDLIDTIHALRTFMP